MSSIHRCLPQRKFSLYFKEAFMHKICLSHCLRQDVIILCTIEKQTDFPLIFATNYLWITETKINIAKDFMHWETPWYFKLFQETEICTWVCRRQCLFGNQHSSRAPISQETRVCRGWFALGVFSLFCCGGF